MSEMQEYRIKWAQCPTNHNPLQVLFVEAPDSETAKAVAKDHIERTYGIGWIAFQSVEPYTKPTGGRVVGDPTTGGRVAR